jgi:hypothetical protein
MDELRGSAESSVQDDFEQQDGDAHDDADADVERELAGAGARSQACD